jgi:hypothetical protein
MLYLDDEAWSKIKRMSRDLGLRRVTLVNALIKVFARIEPSTSIEDGIMHEIRWEIVKDVIKEEREKAAMENQLR